jgi:hypothetical protein
MQQCRTVEHKEKKGDGVELQGHVVIAGEAVVVMGIGVEMAWKNISQICGH